MKTILPVLAALIMLASCNAVTVPNAPQAENYNLSQAKGIIISQKKVRKKQVNVAEKNRKQVYATQKTKKKERKDVRIAYQR